MRILVTGATGYVGGRLVPRLLAAGHAVRVLVRDPSRVAGRPWADRVEISRGDVLVADTLREALSGIDVAYYLVHSMGAAGSFEDRDHAAAGNFGAAARSAGVKRIVFLGRRGDPARERGATTGSSRNTGDRLRACGPPVTEFRAGVIVGSGSVSFEMVRYLTERVPLMVCPRWVFHRIQPIGMGDVLQYLVAALDVPESAGQIIDVGGADVLTYRDMMLALARRRRLRRIIVPLPLVTRLVSAHWIHWITPVPLSLARPLIDALGSDGVVAGDAARRLFPEIKPATYEQALDAALARLDRGDIESSWSDSLASTEGDRVPAVLTSSEGMLLEQRQLEVLAPSEAVFRSFTGLGGQRGWLYAGWLWQLRGLLDRAVGGVGLRRGRRDPDALRPGDALDFWRVEQVEPGSLLRLRAEMKVPGRAWLEFRVRPSGEGRATLMQTAYFAPHGLAGLAYWYALCPLHAVIFSKMVRRIAERARRIAAGAAG